MTRSRCYSCKKGKPDEETTLVSAKIGGDYRRAPRPGKVRVCRDCTQSQVDFARRSQAEGKSHAVNTGRIQWEQAAKFFGIDMGGLLLDRMTGRRA